MEAVIDFIFLGCKITVDCDCGHEIKRCLLLGRKNDKPRQHIKKQRHHFVDKGPYSQGYGLSSSHVQMWQLDHKEGRALKNWCFWTVVLEKTLESPLDSRKMKPVNPKEINSEYSLEGLMLKLQYFGHQMWRANSLKRGWCWEKLKAGGEEGNRG